MKAKNILYYVLAGLFSFGFGMSAIMKVSQNPDLVANLTKGGYGNYVVQLGVAMLAFLGLYWYPKTHKVGFLLLLSYLGGAASLEIGSGNFPVALVFITMLWVAEYLKKPEMIVE